MPRRPLVIDQRFYVLARPSRVFRALSESHELCRWLLDEAELPLKKGSPYRFRWQGGYSHRGRVLDVVPNRRLTLSWPNRVGRRTRVSKVTFSVARRGRGTMLRLRHAGFEPKGRWIEEYGDTQAGWAYFLLNLKSVLEHGRDLRSLLDT